MTARDMRINGASLSAIAREIGVTRQAVARRERKEGWLNQTGQPGPTDGMDPKRAVIANLRRGCTLKVAAGAIGVHPNTVGNWRKSDQKFDAECTAAMNQYAADRITDLTRASERGDVRATRLALEKHEATRSDFGPEKVDNQLLIVLNVSRSDEDEPREAIIWDQCDDQKP